jgi:hypothetical protein
MAPLITTPLNQLAVWASQYESTLGSAADCATADGAAKQVWFEARAVVSRLVFRAERWTRPPVLLDRQLQLLPELIGRAEADELTALCRSAFALRESPATAVDRSACRDVSVRLGELRAKLALPGVPPPSSPCPLSEECPS